MPAMRVSLTARFVSHPAIDFGGRHTPARHAHLGLGGRTTTYHQPLATRRSAPTVDALRSHTSTFRFPSVGRFVGVSARRALLPLGLSRSRRG
jgi:hypothetical protein